MEQKIPENPQWMETLKSLMPEPEEDYKGGMNRSGLYTILLRKLKELNQISQKEIIPFKTVFEKLCRNFSISKRECWDVLFTLNDVGIIKIVPYHGIKVNY